MRKKILAMLRGTVKGPPLFEDPIIFGAPEIEEDSVILCYVRQVLQGVAQAQADMLLEVPYGQEPIGNIYGHTGQRFMIVSNNT